MDFGNVPTSLPALPSVQELLITTVHIFREGHYIRSSNDAGRTFTGLPREPEQLNVLVLKPANKEYERARKQFAHDFNVRRSVISKWLAYLKQSCIGVGWYPN